MPEEHRFYTRLSADSRGSHHAIKAGMLACLIWVAIPSGCTPDPGKVESPSPTSSPYATYYPTPTPYMPYPTPLSDSAQQDLLRSQRSDARRLGRSLGMMAFLSCAMQGQGSSPGMGQGTSSGMGQLLGCAGQGLQQATLFSSLASNSGGNLGYPNNGNLNNGYPNNGNLNNGYPNNGNLNNGYPNYDNLNNGYPNNGNLDNNFYRNSTNTPTR